MTQKRKMTAARWSLPEVIDPVDKRCVMLLIPDEPYHIAAFRGALAHLAQAHKWAEDVDHTARDVAWVWQGIIDSMEWGCGVPESECRDFPPYAGFIEWHPTNPFIEPNEVPEGYIFPPFQIVTEDNLLQFLGYSIGDVLTDLTRFWGGTGVITDPESGFARFRLNLTGVGRVQLYLLAFPLGGFALVTTDDDPLSAVFVDTEMDLTSAPIENNEEIINEIIFETEGEHHIDVTFVPKINDALNFFGYGGGLRKVKLCGFDEMEDVAVFDIRQDPTRPCIIQKRPDDGAAWTDAVNIQLCPPKIRVNNGVIEWQDDNGDWNPVDTGDERVDGTAPIPYPSDPDGNCLAAENITAVYQTALTEIRAGITASRDLVAIAAGISGIMSAFMPLAIVSTIAFALTASALAVGGAGLDDMLDEESLENFKCSIFCNIQTDGSITASNYTDLRASMESWAATVELEIINIWLDAFGSVGLQRMALAAGITTGDCSSCICGWCYEWDFSANDGGFVGSILGGNYSAGLWSYIDAQSGTDYYRGVEIKKTFTGTVTGATKLEFIYNMTKGSAVSGGSLMTGARLNGTSEYNFMTFDEMVNGDDQLFTWDITGTIDDISASARSSSSASAAYSGNAAISKVRLIGAGTLPTDLTGGEFC